MAELNGAPTQGRCAGDGDEAREILPCRRWQTAGDTPEERNHACVACPTCEGRVPVAVLPPSEEEDEEILASVERLVIEQCAGRSIMPSAVTALEWEALLEWHKHEDGYKRADRARMKQMYEVAVAQLKARH